MNNKPNILFVLPGFTVGGTVYSTLNMLDLLKKEGYNFSVLAMTHQGPVKESYVNYDVLDELYWLSLVSGIAEKEQGFKRIISLAVKLFIRLFSLFGINLKRIVYRKAAKHIERSGQFDIIVACQEGPATNFVSYFQNVKKIAWVRCEYSSYRGMITDRQFAREKSIVYPSYNSIVCVSETTREGFISYFSQLSERVHAIHNIQNINSIRNKAEESVDEEFDNNCFCIVSIGRFAPQKRFCKIPEIADAIRKQGFVFKWYIIGDGNIEGEGDRLKENITYYHCDDIVLLLGHKNNPYPYIKSSDLLVNTSSTEACPRVLSEAMILGTPVVCADFNSAKEFVTNGVNGFVGSLEELPTIIGTLICDKQKYDSIKVTITQNSLTEEMEHIMNQLKDIFI